METKTETKIDRLDNETIVMVTTITQKLTNQEFYDQYASMSVKIEDSKKAIEHNKDQIRQAEVQVEINEQQKEDTAKMAESCRVRIPSKPVEKKK